MTKYYLNHALLADMMNTGKNDLNDTLCACISLNLYNDLKKILTDYKGFGLDFSFILNMLVMKKNRKKMFSLLRPMFDFSKINLKKALIGIHTPSNRDAYNREVLTFIYDNANFTRHFKQTITFFELRDYIDSIQK